MVLGFWATHRISPTGGINEGTPKLGNAGLEKSDERVKDIGKCLLGRIFIESSDPSFFLFSVPHAGIFVTVKKILF